MEPIAETAGTALVGAMASDGWSAARAEVVAFWRRVRADEADAVAGELTEIRAEVLAARQADDPDLERSLADGWQRRLREVLAGDPAVAAELRLIVDEHLTPTLAPDERTRVTASLPEPESGRAEPGDPARRD